MKHLIIALTFLLVCSFSTQAQTAAKKVADAAGQVVSTKTSKKISTEKSTVNWVGYKVTGQHAGTIGLSSGVLEFEKDALVGGQFEIDMTSITVTDLEGEWKDKLEGHLKAPDFFGVEDFGTATFVITKVAPKGTPGDYKVTGDLTIKGITKEIRFYTNLSKDGLAVADITIDRTDYDIKYGSSSFFDSLGDKTIYDDFDLKISLVVQ